MLSFLSRRNWVLAVVADPGSDFVEEGKKGDSVSAGVLVAWAWVWVRFDLDQDRQDYVLVLAFADLALGHYWQLVGDVQYQFLVVGEG